MKCSTRGCPYPQDRRGLCNYHALREEPIGDLRRGTVTPGEHDIWCDMENIRHEDVMRSARREQLANGRLLNAEEIANIHRLYLRHGSIAEVRRLTRHNPKTIKKYTAELRGVA